MALKAVFLFSVLLSLTLAEPRGRGRGKVDLDQHKAKVDLSSETRDPRIFSIFNIVQFNNQGCRSQSTISGGGTGSTNRNGTCFTTTECSSKGGTASGSCAAGFGVCCIFLVSTSGSAINQNCTYIRNPGFPNAYTDTNAVQYTINKCSNNVCHLRLDFESFTIQGTGNTLETQQNAAGTAAALTGGVCLDTFDVTTSTGQNIPTICGQNTGQHMYVDVGLLSSDSATLNFAFAGSSNTRMWEIKVTQIPCYGECSKDYAPPPDCLQYHTGLTGRFTTFNFLPTNDNHLRNQEYSVCIRQEEGFCCIQYMPCADANSFTLDTNKDAAVTTSAVDTDCTLDYIGIEGASAAECNQGGNQNPIRGRFCGQKFNASPGVALSSVVCDCTQPFRIDVYTDNLDDAGMQDTTATSGATVQSRGVCLTWRQIPCN